MSLPSLLPAILLAGTPPQPAPPVEAAAPASVTLPVLPQDAPTSSAPPPARPPHAKGDPLENFNRRMFKAYQGIDKAVFRPAAMGYKHVVPVPVRSGIRNFFSNLGEPIVFLNYILQLKFGKAGETLGRFVVNSTVGIGGLADVAKNKAVNLPHRSNGFGNTLGFYGVKPGPYIFLPIVGPTTLRDFLGGQADAAVLPASVGKPFTRVEYQVPRTVLRGLNERAESDGDLKALFDSAVDPYATLRSVYLQNRAAEIQALKGRPATSDDPLADPLKDPLADPVIAEAPQSTTPELSDPLDDPALEPTPSN